MSNIYDDIQNHQKPRVHIKYEVETENGTVEKELPFVIGVLGNFSGNTNSASTKDYYLEGIITVDK